MYETSSDSSSAVTKQCHKCHCLQVHHLTNVKMSKFKPNMAGQSVVDRVLAAKHTVAGQSLAKVICKATTEEVMGPKRKHLDCKFC